MEQLSALSPTPVAEPNRAELLDALRGFALGGVCLANLFVSFSLWKEPTAPPAAALATAATDPAAAFPGAGRWQVLLVVFAAVPQPMRRTIGLLPATA